MFANLQEFLAMGTHGPYVWSAYALALLVVGGNLHVAITGRRKALDEVRRKLRREESE